MKQIEFPTFHQGKNLKETLTILSRLKKTTREKPALLAGGTDIYVLLNAGQFKVKNLVSLNLCKKELAQFEFKKDHLLTGSMVTYTQLLRDKTFNQKFPMLVESFRQIGAVQIQNCGTLGGNIGNGSPAGDSLPPLLALNATILLQNEKSEREIPLCQFFTGYKTNLLQPDELIKAIKIPFPTAQKGEEFHQFFKKIATRKAQAISKVIVALTLKMEKGGKISESHLALGSVGPVPFLIPEWNDFWKGKKMSQKGVEEALKIVDKNCHPLDDVRSTAFYRRKVIQNTLQKYLETFISH